ncbi:hypothetical protein ABIF61_007877 [Bradyrhizobium japonicum]
MVQRIGADGVDRGIEIVAERGADGLFKALVDGDAVDDRRPQILGLAVEDLGDRARLGFEPLCALVGLDQRRARGFQRLACRDVGGFARLRRGFRGGQRLLRGLDRRGQLVEIAKAASLGGKLLLFRSDVRDLLVEPGQLVAVGADIGLELVALGGEVGQRGGELGELLFGFGQHRLGFADALVDTGALLDARLDLFLQLGVFGVEPLQRDVGVHGLLLGAGDIAFELGKAALELGDALLGALLLAVEQLASIGQALQACGGARLGIAQRRHFGGADRLDAGGFGLVLGALGHLAHREIVGLAGFVDVGMGADPAQVEQGCFGLADLGRDLAVAQGLAGLLLQAFHLSCELADHVLDAGEVGFGRLQPQLGLVAAGVQTGDAGSVFQHATALLGLGLDDLADLALVDESRRTRAGGGIRKQDLHVAGAHVAAVDAIDRPRLALDAAGDFEQLAVVHRRRRGAIGIVDRHRHFGVVARGTVAGACEDHRVHVGGAQRLVRGLTHRPAQRFDEIRLAAAVGADHAGQAGLDDEVRGLNEGLETVKAQAGDFHKHASLLAGANPPAGTLPWKTVSLSG